MNALRLLMSDHDKVEGTLVDLGQAMERGEAARSEAQQEFARVLLQHLRAEEELFYSAVDGRLILVKAQRFLDEHERLRELLQAFVAEQDMAAAVRRYEELHDAVVQHVSDEEIELFPEVKRRFDMEELEQLGEKLELAEPPEAPELSSEPAPEET